jgi:universal stress protein A
MSPDTRREGTHKYGVDLIVMDTHDRTGLAHLLLGSAAEYVLRHAPYSVFVM